MSSTEFFMDYDRNDPRLLPVTGFVLYRTKLLFRLQKVSNTVAQLGQSTLANSPLYSGLYSPSQNMIQFLLLHGNIGYGNAPLCYVTSTLTVLFTFTSHVHFFMSYVFSTRGYCVKEIHAFLIPSMRTTYPIHHLISLKV